MRSSMLTCAFALTLMALAGSPAFAQSAPGWSRGQQSLAISYAECLNRARHAIQNEGYRTDYNAGNFVVGIKGYHTAVIICDPVTASKMSVQVVVASNGPGGGVERQRLQAEMALTVAAVPPAAPVNVPAGPVPPAWSVTAVSLRDARNLGQKFTYDCPAGGPPQAKNLIGGVPLYSDYSSICEAAVHYGAITPARGGKVTILYGKGQLNFTGSTSHGYTSKSYDGYSAGTFVIYGAQPY